MADAQVCVYGAAVNWDKDSVRDFRETYGWSQRQLADAVGVSLRTVQLWEAGDPPSARSRKALDRVKANPEGRPLTDAELRQLVPRVLAAASEAQLLAAIAERFARYTHRGIPPNLPGPTRGRWIWQDDPFATGESDSDDTEGETGAHG